MNDDTRRAEIEALRLAGVRALCMTNANLPAAEQGVRLSPIAISAASALQDRCFIELAIVRARAEFSNSSLGHALRGVLNPEYWTTARL